MPVRSRPSTPGRGARRCAGQAAAEYVAVVLLVAAALAGAAAAALAVPAVGDRVVRVVRTGLCIVGGDLCRSSDAAAAGLEPCLTGERTARQDTTLDLAIVRLGGHGEWQLALRSDGGAVVTRLEETELGGVVGIGASFSPVGIGASASAVALARYRGGRAWRFADGRAAAAFLDGAMHDAAVQSSRRPDIRWDALGGEASGAAGVALAQLAGAGLTIGANRAIGLRRDGALRTLTVDVRQDGLQLAGHLPGYPRPAPGRTTVIADVTWESGELRDLMVRSADAAGDRVVELSARIDLDDARARGLAERLLRPGGGSAGDLRAVADLAAAEGIVERTSYTQSDRRRGMSLAARLGLSLGFSHQRIQTERRLTDAVAWVRGGPAQRRLDCLGV